MCLSFYTLLRFFSCGGFCAIVRSFMYWNDLINKAVFLGRSIYLVGDASWIGQGGRSIIFFFLRLF